MGYQLNRPDLRREVERECNFVASGQKTKEQILHPILQKMKEIFDRANAEAHKLDAAIGRHFQRIGSDSRNYVTIQNDYSLCGCGQSMTLKGSRTQNEENRNNRSRAQCQEKILICGSCKIAHSLPSKGVPTAAVDERNNNPIKCPICSFQVLKVSNGNGYTGNGYHICPKCYTDSPVEHGGDGSGNFRCFNCTHRECSLSGGTRGGDVEIFVCPFCAARNESASITLKKTTRSFVLSCSSYGSGNRCNYTMWLPREASEVIPLSEDVGDNTDNLYCSRCPNKPRKLQFTWKSGSVPPHFGRTHIGCVLCDPF